jgi:integrase
VVRGRKRRSREGPRDALPQIFRRRGWYAADFRRWGKGRITLRDPDSPTWPHGGERTSDLEVAARWVHTYLDLFRTEIRRRHLKLGPSPKQLGEAAASWLDVRQRVQAANTWKNNRSALAHLREQLGSTFATDRLTTPVLQAFFDELHQEGYAPSTLETYRQSLSSFLRWLGQEGRNAALRVTLPEVIQEEVHTWEPEELEQLRAAADRLDRTDPSFRLYRLSLELGLASGGRRHELFAVRWEQIREAAKTIRFTHQLAIDSRALVPLKGKKARTTLLLPGWWEWHRPTAKGFILTTDAGELLSPSLLSHLRARLLTAAEIHRPGVGWHVDRHTYAREYMVEGGRYQELQRSLGHKSIVTTEELYGHFGEDVAAELARRRIYREEPLHVVR